MPHIRLYAAIALGTLLALVLVFSLGIAVKTSKRNAREPSNPPAAAPLPAPAATENSSHA